MNWTILNELGLGYYNIDDFYVKPIVLRDGRDSILWVHEPTGHGILDPESWVKEDFYSEQYRDEFSADSEGKRKESEEHFSIYKNLNDRQFDLFKDRLTNDTKYLEIGCAHGGIVSRVNNYGVDECQIVEPNIQDSNFVKYKNPNVIVHNSVFGDVELEDNYFDIVAAFDVVEHDFEPGKFLKKCYDSLKVGGTLIIAVPNHNDILLTHYDCDKYQEFYYHKAHVNYFTEESIKELCESVGFSGSVSSFLDYSFFNHVHWYQTNEPMGSGVTAFIGDVLSADDSKFRNKINNFYKNTELEYEKIVNENMGGGALIYNGVKNV